MVRRGILIGALGALLALPGTASAGLSRHIDPMIGTFAPGFVVPGAAAPFGMVQNSPDTRGEFAYSGYVWHDPTIQGFSLIHLSGPGVKKAGDIPFMPIVGEVDTDPDVYAAPYTHADEEAAAGYYRVRLGTGIDVELTAARRAALQRYTFPPAGDPKVIVDVKRNMTGTAPAEFAYDEATGEARGVRRGKYPVFFVARFSKPVTSHGTFDGGGWLGFEPGQTVTMRVGVSFVDYDGARANLEADAPGFDIEAMRARTARAWDRELAKVRVGGGTKLDRRAFYTALYHSFLHPNVFSDVDGRYRGFDGAVHAPEGHTVYANFSSWDTYKAQNQLLAIVQPRRYRDMLRTLLLNHRQGGKLPRWGEQSVDASHMSGDPAIPMIVDGYCRGVIDGQLAGDLYDASLALRTHRPAELAALGYLPGRPGTTLEYGVADFALALMADRLGRPEAQALLDASLNYRNILDPETRWIRPRNADGSWHSPFFTNDMTGFQEGNSWQYSWLAPHDARGLFDRMGGDDEVRSRFEQFFAAHPEAQNRLTFFGVVYYFPQYAPGNEHDIQAPWMPVFAGSPWKGAEVHRNIQTLFRATIDGLPGNDDLGGLSAWHVFSALGFGPVTPGAPFHVIGSPQFSSATIKLPGGKRFRMTAPANNPAARYVVGAKLDGEAIDRAWFEDARLRDGGTLELEMSPVADKAWASEARPPSVSDTPLAGFGCGTV